MVAKNILVQYSSTCTFAPKVEWFNKILGDKLKVSAPGVEFNVATVGQKGFMDVKVDGAVVYAKGGLDPSNPQPTPEEVAALMSGLLNAAGIKGELSEEQLADFKGIHEEQKSKLVGQKPFMPKWFEDKFWELSLGERLDEFCKKIMLEGLERPYGIYAGHFLIWLANYGIFTLLAFLLPADASGLELGRLLFAKFMVWQHLAEGIGCRQGPLNGHSPIPDNYKYRLSVGTLKCPAHPALKKVVGTKRNYFDALVHALWFVSGFGFVFSPSYSILLIRMMCVCDVWIFLSDMSQFYASTGHGYFTMLLSLCVPADCGQLAGVQLALIYQWFFSGVGKIGPWFNYVNGPFMCQSHRFRGQRWLFNLLFKSPEDLSPTNCGILIAQSAAAVEYLAPLALMLPWNAAIWAGLVGITAMHVYILTMPAPFDVYSWNTCFMCAGVYLFYLGGSFGFDWVGFSNLLNSSPWLAAVLFAEFLMCSYGQFFTNKIGYYLSHRYWAGNWVQGFYFVKKTDAASEKLNRVKNFGDKVDLAVEFTVPNQQKFIPYALGYMNIAYLWVATFNMKSAVRLIEQGMKLFGSSNMDEWAMFPLAQHCCGEFRDQLYAADLLQDIQEICQFEEGECWLLHLGSFPMCGSSAFWKIYDLNKGEIASGTQTVKGLQRMHRLPSQSTDLSIPLTDDDDKQAPLLQA